MDIRVPFSVINELKALTGGRLEWTPALSLIAGDADDIKGYLYDSPALPEIRGASIHLYKLNETGIKTVLRRYGLNPPGRFLLFSAGGGFGAVVPSETAHAIATDIEKLYLDRTGSSTITTTIFNLVPIESSFHIPFGQIMQHMAHSLRRKKLDKSIVPFYPAFSFARRCTSCHLRPAIRTVVREEEQLRLCEPCDLKRRRGARNRSPYQSKILRRLSSPHLSFPQTLADIGAHSMGYIAVVAADGNSVGNELFNLQRPEDYRALSSGLTHAIEEAVFGVLADMGKDCLASRKIPAEVIVTGGDDTLFIVPCQYGLKVAVRVCRRFAEETDKLIHKRLTMSAGVIIAPDNYPMYFLEQMATVLLHSAKRLAREKKEGCVDFWFFRGHGTMGTDPLAVRRSMLERSLDSRTRLCLHERPYTIDELDKLVDFAQRFVNSEFPRSRLYGLRQALDVGRYHATLFFLYQLARSSKDQQALLRNFQAEFMARPDSVPPWNQRREDGQTTHSTPFVDLVDACDLLRKESCEFA